MAVNLASATSRYSFSSLFAIGALLLNPAAAFAHPLGNFSINHYSGIRVERNFIDVRYLIDMAEIPTFQEVQNSGIAAKPEDAATLRYVKMQAEQLKKGLTLTVNGHPLVLRTESAEVIFPLGAGGLPTMKMGFSYRAAVPEVDDTSGKLVVVLYYADDNFPNRIGWKETVATAGPGIKLLNASVPTAGRSAELSNYPTDLLNSPPQVIEARLTFREDLMATDQANGSRNPVVQPASESAPRLTGNHALPKGLGETRKQSTPDPLSRKTDSTSVPTTTSPIPERADSSATSPQVPAVPRPALLANRQLTPQNRFTELITSRQFGLWFLLVAATIAAGLGALHALEPGHGKTIVAAYLVGSKGTAYHAFLLGLIVTISHTAGVFALGAVTLYASRYIVPEQLYPWLGAVSGLLIAALGSYLFLRRFAGHEVGHSHGPGGHHHHHDHGDSHVHSHGRGHTHSRDEHAHTHDAHGHEVNPSHQTSGDVSYRQLLTLGITGGIVPCPAALVVLLSAVALNRVGFGMFLILAFSIGLAAVLIAVGLLMVYARKFMTHLRSEGPFFTRWLPLTSAAVITLLGLGIAIRSLVNGGILQIRV